MGIRWTITCETKSWRKRKLKPRTKVRKVMTRASLHSNLSNPWIKVLGWQPKNLCGTTFTNKSKTKIQWIPGARPKKNTSKIRINKFRKKLMKKMKTRKMSIESEMLPIWHPIIPMVLRPPIPTPPKMSKKWKCSTSILSPRLQSSRFKHVRRIWEIRINPNIQKHTNELKISGTPKAAETISIIRWVRIWPQRRRKGDPRGSLQTNITTPPSIPALLLTEKIWIQA